MSTFPNPAIPLISPEVSKALAERLGVVALESTIITHGMPYPVNVETALAVEGEVRARGAIPATIAIVNGRIRVGLSLDEIEKLGKSEGAVKLSRDNLAMALAKGQTGSTTVAATMICADRAGIPVFATGGIGGVHRGAETSFDISADLLELVKTSVLVVCAGAKAILDAPKTLEVLETNGVPVIGYQSDNFAAFWSRDSGLKLQMREDTPIGVARFLAVRHALGLKEGVLISNPVPKESEIPAPEMKTYIDEALRRADEAGVTGKAVTPFLLKEILDITGGKSLRTNVALIKNNASLAAEIARARAEMPQP